MFQHRGHGVLFATLSHPSCSFEGRPHHRLFDQLTGLACSERWKKCQRGASRGRLMVKFSWLIDPHPPSVSFSLSISSPLCGPWSPPLDLWPLASTPSVLLSTHCVPSKNLRVKAAPVKVKMHLLPGLFVQGCLYAGCDQASKFSSKINQPPSPSPLCIPREMHPPGQSFLFHCYLSHLWQKTCSLFILLSVPPLLNPPSFCSVSLHSTRSQTQQSFIFSTSFSLFFLPTSFLP